jgi:hypothetical protein
MAIRKHLPATYYYNLIFLTHPRMHVHALTHTHTHTHTHTYTEFLYMNLPNNSLYDFNPEKYVYVHMNILYTHIACDVPLKLILNK